MSQRVVTELAGELMDEANGTGSTLSIVPAQGAHRVIQAMQGGALVSSNHHQVYTDGQFAFDPLYSETPVRLAEYREIIKTLNGPMVELHLFQSRS